MYIGIDVGGTSIRIASSSSLEDIQLKRKTNFSNSPDYQKNEHQIIETIKNLGEVQGIGISSPGSLNEQKSEITSATNVKQWIGKPIVETLSGEFGCPVLMNHDAYCAALGEATYGRKLDDFDFIIYGTGIGLARVRREQDRLEIHRDTPEERADFLKAWEDECGGRRIEQEFGQPPSEFSDQNWQIVLDKFCRHLSVFVAGTNPTNIVFGGGIAVKQWPRLRKAFGGISQSVKIDVTPLGEDAGLYGALALLANQKSWVV